MFLAVLGTRVVVLKPLFITDPFHISFVFVDSQDFEIADIFLNSECMIYKLDALTNCTVFLSNIFTYSLILLTRFLLGFILVEFFNMILLDLVEVAIFF